MMLRSLRYKKIWTESKVLYFLPSLLLLEWWEKARFCTIRTQLRRLSTLAHETPAGVRQLDPGSVGSGLSPLKQ